MIYLIVGIIVCIIGIIIAEYNYSDSSGVFIFLTIVLVLITLTVGIVKKNTKIMTPIINSSFNTSYTEEEIFWSGADIIKLHEIQGKKLELRVVE